MSKEGKNKKKKRKGCTVFYFVATAIVTVVAVRATIKEGKRIKAENELLSYDVW